VAETSDRDVLVLAPMGLEWRAVRRALAAAYDPALKQAIQQLIDRLCRVP